MNLQVEKMELIEMLINIRKATVLRKVRELLEEEQCRLTEEDYKIIDSRRELHLSGESKSYTLEKVKQRIKNK